MATISQCNVLQVSAPAAVRISWFLCASILDRCAHRLELQLRNPNCNWGAPSRHSKESGICQPFSVGHLHPHEPDSLGQARGLKRTHLETPLFLVVLVPWCQGANAFTSPPQQLEQLTPEQGGLVMHEAQMWRRYVTSSGQALLQSLGHPTPAFAASELHLAAGSRVEAFNAGSIQHVLSTATIPPPGPS